jgi:hypothetical protein
MRLLHSFVPQFPAEHSSRLDRSLLARFTCRFELFNLDVMDHHIFPRSAELSERLAALVDDLGDRFGQARWPNPRRFLVELEGRGHLVAARE